jgi:putative sigma-54 modulation protein
MNINISIKGMEMTLAIKEYAEKKIEGLDKFYNKITQADIRLGKNSNHHSKGEVYFAECKLGVPGNDLFAEKTEADLYKAIDKLRDYLEIELKKRKDKLTVKEKKDKRAVRESKEYQG